MYKYLGHYASDDYKPCIDVYELINMGMWQHTDTLSFADDEAMEKYVANNELDVEWMNKKQQPLKGTNEN